MIEIECWAGNREFEIFKEILNEVVSLEEAVGGNVQDWLDKVNAKVSYRIEMIPGTFGSYNNVKIHFDDNPEEEMIWKLRLVK